MSEAIEDTQKLDRVLRKIGRIYYEIVRVRNIVGACKDFQDFRVLTTDIEALKESHIHKDVFAAEIRRLDEKIEKGLEALNKRIDDFRVMRFWSKRTLLDIALVIWGTIVTLYAAGILKFW